MSKTITQIAQSVQTWLGIDQEDTDERLPIAVALDMVNWARKEYCRNRESRFNENSDNFATVAQTRDYVEPALGFKPRKLWYINPDNGSVKILQERNKDEFDAMYPSSVVYSTGGPYTVPGTNTSQILDDPESYALWGGKILLAKVPKRILTIFRDYWSLPADLSGSQEDNFTKSADQYLLFKALSNASAFGVEDSRIPMWTEMAMKLESNLDSEDARRL